MVVYCFFFEKTTRDRLMSMLLLILKVGIPFNKIQKMKILAMWDSDNLEDSQMINILWSFNCSLMLRKKQSLNI